MQELMNEHYEEARSIKNGEVVRYLENIDDVNKSRKEIEKLEKKLEMEKQYLDRHLKYFASFKVTEEVNDYLDLLIQKRIEDLDKFKSYKVPYKVPHYEVRNYKVPDHKVSDYKYESSGDGSDSECGK